MSSSLYDVGTEAIALQDALFDSMGELTPETEAKMDAMLANGETALVSAAWVVDKLEADAELCRAEAKRLTARAEAFEKNVANLKARMLFAVDAAFNGKLKTATRTIWGQNAKPGHTVTLAEGASLEALDVTHSELVKKSYRLDNTAVVNRWAAGDPLPSVLSVVENPPTRFLRIK